MTITVSTTDPRDLAALGLFLGHPTWQKRIVLKDGRRVYAIPSRTRPGLYWLTDGSSCGCEDDRRGNRCAHARAAVLYRLHKAGGAPISSRPSNPLRDAAADDARVVARLGNLCVECRGPRGTDAIGDRCRACGLGLEEAF